MCRVRVRIIHLTMAPTRHISELKYALTNGTFPILFANGQNRRCLFTRNLRLFKPNIAEAKTFLLIVSHNTEGPPISDWQWRHRMLFFFVGEKNRVNLLLFFKPWWIPKYYINLHYLLNKSLNYSDFIYCEAHYFITARLRRSFLSNLNCYPLWI